MNNDAEISRLRRLNPEAWHSGREHGYSRGHEDGREEGKGFGAVAAYTEIANWKQPDHPVQCPCPTCPTIRSVARNIAHAAAVGIHQQAGYNVLDATDRADALIEDDEMVRLLHDAPGMAIVQIVQTGLAMLQHEPPPQT